MKRQSGLIEKIADFDNLYLAWYKAKKGKSTKPEVVCFAKKLNDNLIKMQSQILSGNVLVGNYTFFTIYEPKKRKISAATFSERILHHAIMNICHHTFEKHLLFHSYATRKNKGTYAALDKAKIWTKKYKYYARLDIRKFFDSIEHAILKENLLHLFKDKIVIKIFNQIIDSYSTTHNRGIPIGNLTSQYFANYYLSIADHFILEKIKIPAYMRYMDDMLLFDNNLPILKQKVKLFTNFVKQYLSLDFKTVNISNTHLGVPFLGYRIFPETIKLNKNSKKRFKKKIKINNLLLEKGIWTQKEYQLHTMPLLAFVKYADTLNLRKNIIFGI